METNSSTAPRNHISLIGQSEAIQRVRDLIEKVADSDSTILLHGESGTGKEVVAKAIHYQGLRASKSFVPINCGAIPESLLESELFGHEKGAFTGANTVRQGRFELADGGTLFFDEISEMPYPLQVKLLRAIQEREFERIGGSRSIRVDVRIIAATNVDLEQAVLEKKFRKDLFYRLNVIPITLPSLRERKEDIPLFISHFLHQFNQKKQRTVGISSEATDRLMAYPWLGNIRELENMMERMVILAEGEVITVDDLPQKIKEGVHQPLPPLQETDPHLPFWAAASQADVISAPPEEGALSPPTSETETSPIAWPGRFSEEGVNFTELVEAFEDRLMQEALKRANGVKSRAAQLLHLNRTTLVEKLKRRERPSALEEEPKGDQ